MANRSYSFAEQINSTKVMLAGMNAQTEQWRNGELLPNLSPDCRLLMIKQKPLALFTEYSWPLWGK